MAAKLDPRRALQSPARRLLEEARLKARVPDEGVEVLVEQLERPNQWDHDKGERLEATQKLLGTSTAQVLAPRLEQLPSPLKRLVLEIDALWGNADGDVSPAEFERVANYYLSAAPFFTDKLSALVELADYLKLDAAAADLRAQLASLDTATSSDPVRATTREYFDGALAESDLPAKPQTMREPAFHSPRYHQLSILEHSAFAVQAMTELAKTAGVDWHAPAAAMLVHDIGKLLAYNPLWGSDSYAEHAEVGAKWLEQRGADPALVFIVRNHEEMRSVGVDEAVKMVGGDRELLARMVLVYLADTAAKGISPGMNESNALRESAMLGLAAAAGLDGPVLLAKMHELGVEVDRRARVASAALAD